MAKVRIARRIIEKIDVEHRDYVFDLSVKSDRLLLYKALSKFSSSEISNITAGRLSKKLEIKNLIEARNIEALIYGRLIEEIIESGFVLGYKCFI